MINDQKGNNEHIQVLILHDILQTKCSTIIFTKQMKLILLFSWVGLLHIASMFNPIILIIVLSWALMLEVSFFPTREEQRCKCALDFFGEELRPKFSNIRTCRVVDWFHEVIFLWLLTPYMALGHFISLFWWSTGWCSTILKPNWWSKWLLIFKILCFRFRRLHGLRGPNGKLRILHKKINNYFIRLVPQ